jgi:hypothetical protein
MDCSPARPDGADVIPGSPHNGLLWPASPHKLRTHARPPQSPPQAPCVTAFRHWKASGRCSDS